MKSIQKQYFIYPPVMMLSLYLTVLGYMIPEIRQAFSLSLAEAGFFSTLQSIGMIASLTLCFCIFSAFNKTRIMAISSFLLAACMILLGVNTNLFILYILFFSIGMFNNIVNTFSSALMMDMAKKKTGFYIALLNALWAAAGAAGPYFAILLGNEYKNAFLGLGILTVLTTIVFLFGLRKQAKIPMLENKSNIGGVGKLIRILKQKGIKTFVATSFFGSFTQVSLMFFLATYAGNIRGIDTDGAFVLSMMFVGMLIGRVIFSKIAHRFTTLKLLSFANLIAIAAFVLMLLFGEPILVGIFAAIGGVFISINTPGLILEACGTVPDDTAAASSLIFFGIASAFFIAPPVIGVIADVSGLRIALLLNSAILIPAIVLPAIFTIHTKQKQSI